MSRIGSLFVVGAMRAGYAARGLVYLIVGLLALGAAASGGSAEGFLGSLQALKEQPWNMPVLLVLSAGLLLYAVWRGLDLGAGPCRTRPRFRLGRALRAVLRRAPARRIRLVRPEAGLRRRWIRHAQPGRADRHRRRTDRAPDGTVVRRADRDRHGLVRLLLDLEGWQQPLPPPHAAHGDTAATGSGPRLRPDRPRHRAGGDGRLHRPGGLDARPRGGRGFGHALEEIHSAWHGRAMLGVSGTGLVAFSLYQFIEASHRRRFRVATTPGRPTAMSARVDAQRRGGGEGRERGRSRLIAADQRQRRHRVERQQRRSTARAPKISVGM